MGESSKYRNVLLVDDDKMTNFLNERVIRKSEASDKITVTMNGQEAIEYLQNTDSPDYTRPDVIFLDINMPVMDGFEFLEAYHDLPEGLKANQLLVMLTTSMLEKDKQRAEQFEVDDFIVKPLDAEKLGQIVNE